MRIKQLKLSGFKSFANKTVINFDENFIGVVGPNGSGKSNVIDAIRWVFGEKSNKSLRGASSSDVIFGGTEKRKRMNIAEVTIVLDNTDRHLEVEFDEVAFTRRLYRSGASEYLINGVEARYKDIQELIMDKGIGKNAFSIISQGKVEEIITTNPENRRLIVEEVAGVLKYKTRKHKTLANLAKTDENLEQVNLILNEIDERRGPLERQAKTAEKYQQYKAELEEKEVDLLVTRLTANEEQLEGLTKLEADSKAELIKLQTTETKLEIEESEISSEQSSVANAIKVKTNQISDKLQLLNSKRTNLQVLRERQALTSNQDGRVHELESKRLDLQAQIHTQRQSSSDYKLQLAEIRKRDNEASEMLSKMRAERNKYQTKVADVKQELNKVTTPFATRKVTSANISGVVTTVGNSFNVDLKYTEAISTIIGGRIHDVITTDRNSATKAIEYLRKNKFGRQTFLPRDAMRPNHVDEQTKRKLAATPGFVGIAIDLIKFDQANFKVFANLLGNVIVCENLNGARMISREVTNRYRIVTLEGDVIQVSGAMSGGRSNRQNKLVLESNLAKARNERDKIELRIENFMAKSDKIKGELIEAETNYRMESSVLSRLNNDLQLIEVELAQFKSEEDKPDETNGIEADINRLEVELERLNHAKAEYEICERKLAEKLDEIRVTMRNIRDEVRVLSKSHNEYEVRLERVMGAVKADLAILREDYHMSLTMAKENANASVDTNQYQIEVKMLKGKIRNLGPINLLAIDEYRELTERFEFIDEQRADLIVAKEKLEAIIEKLDEFFVEAFDKTYRKLRTEFQLVYRELFGGGHADLILTNEDDLLMSGVEIVAQPPGKKLQTISLLSGGEKALTAIALLFAILRIRSLPFAILDEVEAALDEANVKRYAQYIKVFSERTQFIVITHRQGTMELVDSLYGVTMQEKGVSTTVKVSLKEGESYV